MSANELPTLVETLNELIKEGFTEEFIAETNNIKGIKSGKEFEPEQLSLVKFFRFEGMTNPSDSSEILVIESNDGIKGTLVTAYGANISQNPDLISRIRKSSDL